MYPVIKVEDDVPGAMESLGTKNKFWFTLEGNRVLFKAARAETGEDWAEKVAEEICEHLGLPHARYELAQWQGHRGVVTWSIYRPNEQMVHGNELLAEFITEYERSAVRGNTLHTCDNILRCLKPYDLPQSEVPYPVDVSSAPQLFVGYLMLDALIGNSDRHHENWACVVNNKGENLCLSPTYDHASSLGRELQESKRKQQLVTRDQNFTPEAYANRARSAIYDSAQDLRPMTTLMAFQKAAQEMPEAGRAWLTHLSEQDSGTIVSGLDRVPPERIGDSARAFARRVLLHNREQLLQLPKQL